MNSKALNSLGEDIAQALKNEVSSCAVARDELAIEVHADRIQRVLTYLRDDSDCKFKTLVDITAVDWPDREPRFDVVYHLLSMHLNHRIRVKAPVPEGGTIPSVTGIFSAAGWLERELWDMFGIPVAGNPDLRRILSDYGFQGHPLRKDFPLTGFVELRYDEEQKRVVYEPVKLTQEFRNFEFLSPWEDAKYILPGDEKAGEAEEKT